MNKPLTDPNEMRKRLMLAARRGYRVDGDDLAPLWQSPLVRSVFTYADIEGLSGEDRMTVLAYHALCVAERLQDQLVQLINTMPAASIVTAHEQHRG